MISFKITFLAVYVTRDILVVKFACNIYI